MLNKLTISAYNDGQGAYEPSLRALAVLALLVCSSFFGAPAFAASMERVTVNSLEEEADRGGLQPALSNDGRFVAFLSTAQNLVPGVTKRDAKVFVRDRRNGTTEWIPSPGCLCPPSISGDGSIVAFRAPGATSAIVVHSRTTGLTRKLL